MKKLPTGCLFKATSLTECKCEDMASNFAWNNIETIQELLSSFPYDRRAVHHIKEDYADVFCDNWQRRIDPSKTMDQLIEQQLDLIMMAYLKKGVPISSAKTHLEAMEFFEKCNAYRMSNETIFELLRSPGFSALEELAVTEDFPYFAIPSMLFVTPYPRRLTILEDDVKGWYLELKRNPAIESLATQIIGGFVMEKDLSLNGLMAVNALHRVPKEYWLVEGMSVDRLKEIEAYGEELHLFNITVFDTHEVDVLGNFTSEAMKRFTKVVYDHLKPEFDSNWIDAVKRPINDIANYQKNTKAQNMINNFHIFSLDTELMPLLDEFHASSKESKIGMMRLLTLQQMIAPFVPKVTASFALTYQDRERQCLRHTRFLYGAALTAPVLYQLVCQLGVCPKTVEDIEVFVRDAFMSRITNSYYLGRITPSMVAKIAPYYGLPSDIDIDTALYKKDDNFIIWWLNAHEKHATLLQAEKFTISAPFIDLYSTKPIPLENNKFIIPPTLLLPPLFNASEGYKQPVLAYELMTMFHTAFFPQLLKEHSLFDYKSCFNMINKNEYFESRNMEMVRLESIRTLMAYDFFDTFASMNDLSLHFAIGSSTVLSQWIIRNCQRKTMAPVNKQIRCDPFLQYDHGLVQKGHRVPQQDICSGCNTAFFN